MSKAIGFLIVLYGLSHSFTNAFVALDSAATEALRAVETAAKVSQAGMQEKF